MDKFKEYLKKAKDKVDDCVKASKDKIGDLKNKSKKNEPKSKNKKVQSKKVQRKVEAKPVVSSKHRQKDAAVRRTNELNRQKTVKKTVDTKVRHSSTKKNMDMRSRFDKILRMVKYDFSLKNIKKYPHIFAFPVVFVYFELMLRICSGTSLFAHFIYPVLFGIATGFFVSFITVVFTKKINRKISIGVLFATGLIFTADCLIKRSFQWYMPIAGILGGAGDVAGDYIGEAFKAIFSGIPAIILFFMPGVLYVMYGKTYIPVKRFRPVKALRFLGYSVFIMVLAILLSNIGSSAAKYKNQYKFDTATEYFGLLTSLRLETKYSILGNSSTDSFVIDKKAEETEAETEAVVVEYGFNEMDLDFEQKSVNKSAFKDLNAYVQSLKPSKQNAYTGIFKDKNLILICAEAFSHTVINKELTPTLYRMAHKGFNFSEFYQPTWGGSTSTGEYSFLTGIIPLKEGLSMKSTIDKNLYFTMGNQMQRLDYTTYAYHNGSYDFYSRELTHENFGYNQYLGMGNGMEELTDWNVDDTVMFDKTMDVYMSQQPFSIYYMTLSGHCIYEEDSPYTEKYLDRVKSVLGDQYDDTTLYYFCYQMELEEALKLMIEKLEEAGIADDTVICMTSDHYPYGLEDTETFGNDKNYVNDLYGFEVETFWELDRNSWIIWSGCLENEYKDLVCEIDEPTYSLDIVPTLSNLFGLEYDSRLLAGRDVFSNEEAIVVWNDFNWVTERGKYSAASETFYPNEGFEDDEAYVERINNIVANKIAFSNSVIKNNYYEALFGKDTVTVSGEGKSSLKKNSSNGDSKETKNAEKESETEAETKKQK